MTKSFSSRRLWGWCAAIVLLMISQGCASTPPVGARSHAKSDPWERWNRQVFDFNENLDQVVLKPAATTYTKVVPQFVRSSVSHFFGNFADGWSSVNNFLQGKPGRGFGDMMRVGTNTVFGVFGLFDVATEAGIERTREDFGQTLGVWGLPAGPYIVWPLFGPSSLRDSAGIPLDVIVSPSMVLSHDGIKMGVALLQVVNVRANLLGASRMLDDVALDRYAFLRDAYLQRRRSLVYDGDPPDLPAEEEDEDPTLTTP